MKGRKREFVKQMKSMYGRGDRENRSSSVYVMKMSGTSYYKIGYSKSPRKRLASLDVGPMKLKIIFSWNTSYPAEEEAVLHEFFSGQRIRNDREWFNLDWHDLKTIEEVMVEPKELAKIAAIVWGVETGEWDEH